MRVVYLNMWVWSSKLCLCLECVCDSNTSACVVHMCVVSPTCMPSVTLPNIILTYFTCFCVIAASDACSAPPELLVHSPLRLGQNENLQKEVNRCVIIGVSHCLWHRPSCYLYALCQELCLCLECVCESNKSSCVVAGSV